MRMSLIMILIPLTVVVLFILAIVGIKADNKNGGGQEVIKTVYLYLVLFATLMMSIGGSVGVFMAAADIISPPAYYQSYEEYRLHGPRIEPGIGQEEAKLSEQEMMARYKSMVATEKERQISRAKNSLIKSLGWIIVPLPVFLHFQRRLATREA